MAIPSRTAGILISVALSAAMIAAAFWLSTPQIAPRAGAEGAEELLRAYAVQDSDGDGLYDWQEELYGTDPGNPRSFDASMTDREAVEQGLVAPRFAADRSALPAEDDYIPGIEAEPGTLTDRFARDFFEDYLTRKGAGAIPTQDDLLAFVTAWIAQLAPERASTNAFSASAVQTVPGSAEAYRAYAASGEAALAAHTVTVEKSELEYFADGVYRDDDASFDMVRRIGESYRSSAAALMQLSVPAEAAAAHARAANAMMRVSGALGEMAMFLDDPLRGFVGITAYETAVEELIASFGALHTVFAQHAGALAPGEAGYSFYMTLEAAALALQN